jgi:hypothetical protein
MTMPSGWKAPIETTVLETERTIWHNEITKGIFNKHIVDRQGITNYRVILIASLQIFYTLVSFLVYNSC